MTCDECGGRLRPFAYKFSEDGRLMLKRICEKCGRMNWRVRDDSLSGT